MLVALSIPIMIYVYAPVWTQPKRWTEPDHLAQFRWLGRELIVAVIRTALLAALAWWVARSAVRTRNPVNRVRGWPRFCRFLVLADLLGAHWSTCPRSIRGTGPSRPRRSGA